MDHQEPQRHSLPLLTLGGALVHLYVMLELHVLMGLLF